MDTKALTYQYQLSGMVTERNLNGLTHEDSLVQPKAGGNCLNWNLGHMVRTRILTLQVLGKASPVAMDKFAAYDDTALSDVKKAMAWSMLVENFRSLQKPIEEGLRAATAAQLDASAPFSPAGNPDETVGSLLAGLSYHEAYHAGQIALGRRIAGKPGAIKPPKTAVASA